MKITWLTQGGFLLDDSKTRVVIDPYLSDDLKRIGQERMVPSPISFAELKPDLVMFTHDHLDHYDPVSVSIIAEMYPACKFAGPESTRRHHEKLGLDITKFTRFDLNAEFAFEGFRFKAVPAHHSDAFSIGIVAFAESTCIYISGDTLYADDIAPAVLAAATRRPDVVAVCINGKLNNMPWTDAVKLVRAISPKSVIPMHYGLFASNTVDPLPFANAAEEAGVRPVIMTAGKAVKF